MPEIGVGQTSNLSCFFPARLSPLNRLQREDDSRIYAASKSIYSFDQVGRLVYYLAAGDGFLGQAHSYFFICYIVVQLVSKKYWKKVNYPHLSLSFFDCI